MARPSLLNGHDLPVPLVRPAALHLTIWGLFHGVRIKVIAAAAKHALQEDLVAGADGTALLLDDHDFLPFAPGVVVAGAHGAAHD
eukprot:CAMPEP_0117568436 /NCGR_PEP_ID=MMETSP0784-20121206/58135_1 /TAXON_ID=39447 /ORGANISM="" /LENGTH=84 /DNA_ID=CAMNT_0005366365 /DNA_START=27 /DNA_END=278 /DNA_ORIENTATION=+